MFVRRHPEIFIPLLTLALAIPAGAAEADTEIIVEDELVM